jgi:hypothetical protein
VTEPDEAHAAWEACACDRFEDEQNGNPLGLPQGMPNIDDFKDGYRAGQAASAERIKALEEALERIDDLFADAVQFDCENGVRSLNEAASARYLADAPETKAAIHESLEIIRALLKEADQ